MRKTLILLVFLFISIFSFSAKTYQVDRQELIHWSYIVAEHIFSDDLEGWKDVLIGTLAVETNLGQFRGNSIYGVAQMRNGGFQFVQRELKKNKAERETFKKLTGKDPSAVTLKMLGIDYQLSIVYMAFYYKFYVHEKVRPENKEMAAKIWKKYYNTKFGIGTPQRFLSIYAKQQRYIDEYKKSREVDKDAFMSTEGEGIDSIKEIEVLENLESNTKLDTNTQEIKSTKKVENFIELLSSNENEEEEKVISR
ncbi:hypothetical protein EGX98_07540 [Fusobacterium necrophorum]|uniref:Transglycosylase SLT domain-containing protein n=3 Tax=Fusobacterium necrophorum TaxID=859 RepID=A0AB73BZH2_9FUSO|nr:hypothetical protein [Fusobacterium necrophorum]AYZ73887.1 hypothetical protein EGX98_07540 [Fusobacterium necrophorum]AZW10235.1 hypothetical protein EO219_12000 [Fusobacterium necrophorum subsp. necrophorum]KDE60912.1 hypothetical protein FUSO5_12770 [Fusobacterium necrophorum BFTR-1]KDE64879.1 hypothetical protein FUSO4_07020 [Fusobacterium necrophorum DJ-1]KDE65528.1 hypothetical protein FUSO3_00575 [Fusobacterium necrophorum BL]